MDVREDVIVDDAEVDTVEVAVDVAVDVSVDVIVVERDVVTVLVAVLVADVLAVLVAVVVSTPMPQFEVKMKGPLPEHSQVKPPGAAASGTHRPP